MKTKPMAHQDKVWQHSKAEPFYALFWQQGTGKTKTAIDTACYLHGKKEINAVCVIAPNGVHHAWTLKELPKHNWTKSLYLSWEGLNTIKKQKAMRWFMDHKTNSLKWFTINIEALNTKNGYTTVLYMLRKHKTLLIVDESSRIKNQKAKWTKNILSLSNLAFYKRILSGTPLTKNILDLYSQYNFLSPSILGFTSFYAFKAHHCQVIKQTAKIKTKDGKEKQWEYEKIVGFLHTDALIEKIQPFTSRVLKKEVLDLPDKIRQTYYFDLTAKQKKYYKSMKDDMFVLFGVDEEKDFDKEIERLLANPDKVASASIKLTAVMRLRQITQGFVRTESGEDIQIEEEIPKLNGLIDDLQNFEEKTIIWTPFTFDVDLIIKELSKVFGKSSIARYDGKIKEKQRTKTRAAFYSKKDPWILVAKPSVGGTGIDEFKIASNIYYYGSDYNAEYRWQSEDRTHRIGISQSPIYKDFVCRGTIDEKIIRNIQEKKKTEEKTINTLRDC